MKRNFSPLSLVGLSVIGLVIVVIGYATIAVISDMAKPDYSHFENRPADYILQ